MPLQRFSIFFSIGSVSNRADEILFKDARIWEKYCTVQAVKPGLSIAIDPSDTVVGPPTLNGATEAILFGMEPLTMFAQVVKSTVTCFGTPNGTVTFFSLLIFGPLKRPWIRLGSFNI